MRRWVAALLIALGLLAGTACGSSDNGGVIQGTTSTTVATSARGGY